MFLLIIFFNRKRIRNKWLFFSLALFFLLYFLIVSGSLYAGISAEMNLQKFDLDHNGFFTEEERTPAQKKAMRIFSNDTGRTFAPMTGLIFSGIISILVFVIGKLVSLLKIKKSDY